MTVACGTCGALNAPSALFCTSCGTKAATADEFPPVPSEWAPPAPPARVSIGRTPSGATVSLLMGLMTWLLPLALIGFLTFWVTAPVAVATGVAAQRRIDADPQAWKGRGQATTGVALGLAALATATLIESLWLLARLT